jgi:exodeoxyribonuclease VII small subunit
MPTKPKTTFEENMARLDAIVKSLEAGSAPLDKSLALFEEGAGLIKTCASMLDKAEQAVLRLSKSESGEPAEEPFDDAE